MAKEKSEARTLANTRARKYRIPSVFNKEGKKYDFPTVVILFEFVRSVLKDLVGEERDENVFDSEVARFIYPGYPYSHQFKFGLKNISNVIELSLLGRNLGVSFEWIQNVRTGKWSLKQALAAYHARKEGKSLSAQAYHMGSAGEVDAIVRVDDANPALLGDIYAATISTLRNVLSDPKLDKSGSEFI